MKKSLLFFILTISLIMVLTGCENAGFGDDLFGGGSGTGSVSGSISVGTESNLSGNDIDLSGTIVMLVEEHPERIQNDDPTEIVNYGETIVNNDSGNYLIPNVTTGERYYVIAFKDLNGNGLIDIDKESDNGGPIDAAGGHGSSTNDGLVFKQITVDGDETGINIDIATMSDKYTINNFIMKIPTGSDGPVNAHLIDEANVILYGEIEELAQDTSTDSGDIETDHIPNSKFENLVEGTYYVDVSKNGYHNTLSVFNPIMYMADETFNIDFNLVMLNDNQIKTNFLVPTPDTTKGYVVGVFTIDFDQAIVVVEDLLDEYGNSVLDSVDVGYNDMSTAGNYVLDFTATQGKFFGIKNIDPGIYTLLIDFDDDSYEDIDVQIKVEADKVVSVIGEAPEVQ